MAFKLKNTPEKMFHKAEGQVQQPQLPGLKEEGSYAGNPDGAGKYGKNPDAAGKILPAALGIYGAYKAGQALYKGGKDLYNKAKQAKSDYDAGKKARVEKSGGASSENAGAKTDTKPKQTGGKNTKITGAIGSDLRKQQYDAKGWKYDHTIAGDHEGAYKKPSKSTTTKTDTTPKVDTKPKTDTTPKADTTTKTPKKETSAKAAKLRAKGEAALESGNVKKAQRIRKRYDRKTARDKRKAARNSSTPDLSGSQLNDAVKKSSVAQKRYCKK